MAVLNNNVVYFELGGVDLSAYFTGEVSRESSTNLVDITHGSGTNYTQQARGLKTYTLSISLVYKTSEVQTVVMPALYAADNADGGALMIYGPEGKVSGKPKDEVLVTIESISGPSKSIQKDMVMFEISMSAADEPIGLMEWGHVFA
jgi:hypothetical protein